MLYLKLEELNAFAAYANAQGFKTRDHSSLTQKGVQVYHEGHWMGIVWNKNNRCWTVDRRLSELFRRYEGRNKT